MARLFFFVLFSVTQTDSTAPVQPKQEVSPCWLLVADGWAGELGGMPRLALPGAELWLSFFE